MLQFRRRTTRAILVPLTLLIVVLGSSLPASAAGTDNSLDTPPTYVAPSRPPIGIGPLSLKW
jgi:hypothetical protein